MDITSSSPEETERIAARVATVLVPGDVVTVAGDLGAGKTTFVRGACRALGVRERVTSPTFTIGHRYRGTTAISHLDLYRYAALSQPEWGDLEPYFEDAICFVEWPEVAASWLPPPRLAVRLRHADETHRLITLRPEQKALQNTLFDEC